MSRDEAKDDEAPKEAACDTEVKSENEELEWISKRCSADVEMQDFLKVKVEAKDESLDVCSISVPSVESIKTNVSGAVHSKINTLLKEGARGWKARAVADNPKNQSAGHYTLKEAEGGAKAVAEDKSEKHIDEETAAAVRIATWESEEDAASERLKEREKEWKAKNAEENLDQETAAAMRIATWESEQDAAPQEEPQPKHDKESGKMRKSSGVKRERTGNAKGPRYGTRGGQTNPNVEWFSARAAAIKYGYLREWLKENPKPVRAENGKWKVLI